MPGIQILRLGLARSRRTPPIKTRYADHPVAARRPASASTKGSSPLAFSRPYGTSYSGRGLGGPNPTFEFREFNDGFVTIQGGNDLLYATWEGTRTGQTFFFPHVPDGVGGQPARCALGEGTATTVTFAGFWWCNTTGNPVLRARSWAGGDSDSARTSSATRSETDSVGRLTGCPSLVPSFKNSPRCSSLW